MYTLEIKLTCVVLMTLQSIVLENLSNTFSKPNILDVKLGTVLYDDDAPPEKKERMINAAKATTSFETGVRLTGFQVTNQAIMIFPDRPKLNEFWKIGI